MRVRAWRSVACVVLGVSLILLARQVRSVRHPNFVRSFFVDGSPGPAPKLTQTPGAKGLDPRKRVRVVLVDGVNRATAASMKSWRDICAAGIELVVDVGFPTVSLPVQHVLWTGLTQQQSGVQYRGRAMKTPIAHAYPARVPGSVGISEADVDLAEYGLPGKRGGPYQFIVHAFGFTHNQPAHPEQVPEGWASGGFMNAAKAAMGSDAPLVFVHILRTDTVAHKKGLHSAEFGNAAAWADAALAELYRTSPGDDAAFFLISDHGHARGGGHAGPEPSIRRVSGCITGWDLPWARRGSLVHLVDYSRALADALGLEPHERAVGRPLFGAIDAASRNETTLPRPSASRWMIAAIFLILGTLLTAFAAGRHAVALPFWIVVAYLGVLFVEGSVTMTTKGVYRMDGRAFQIAAAPGLVVLAIGVGLSLRKLAAWRVCLAQLALPVALTLACLALCGGLGAVEGVMSEPPLMPRWTAYASMSMSVLVVALYICGIGALGAAVPGFVSRPKNPGSPSADPRLPE